MADLDVGLEYGASTFVNSSLQTQVANLGMGLVLWPYEHLGVGAQLKIATENAANGISNRQGLVFGGKILTRRPLLNERLFLTGGIGLARASVSKRIGNFYAEGSQNLYSANLGVRTNFKNLKYFEIGAWIGIESLDFESTSLVAGFSYDFWPFFVDYLILNKIISN